MKNKTPKEKTRLKIEKEKQQEEVEEEGTHIFQEIANETKNNSIDPSSTCY